MTDDLEPDLDVDLPSTSKEASRKKWVMQPGDPSKLQDHVDRIIGHPRRHYLDSMELIVVDTGWEPNPFQTDKCEHPNRKFEGCMWCCNDCNFDTHRCGGCGEPLEHAQNTCEACRKLYFTDPEDQEE